MQFSLIMSYLNLLSIFDLSIAQCCFIVRGMG